MKRTLLILAALGPAAPALVAPAWAQSNPVAIQAPNGRPAKPRYGGPSEQAPPALPGARAEPTAVAPAARNAMEMPPNEALFDSINRGDLLTAKDAVNRGADLNATNVLGLTPLELAVDLGRNEISFYLLSMRGGTRPNAATAAAAKPPTRAERLAADREARAEHARQAAATRAARTPATPAPPQTARLFAGGGGQPIPQAGFLGFDAQR
jgi:hypothetical protein